MSIRASNVLQGALESSLISHKMDTPIREWSEMDLYQWYAQHTDTRRTWRDPRAWGKWANWKDDQRDDIVTEERIQQQLERWMVRCPLCLLHRNTGCNSHDLSDCQRPEKDLTCVIKSRLQSAMASIEKNGIGGYGEAPWCSNCCLPRSRCRQWNKRDGEGEKDGDDREWRERNNSKECVFPGVVINTVSAMLAFELPSGVTLKQKVEQWRESSRTRFNGDLGLSGWLLSPMLWDWRQMMTMVRVFHQLDIAAEETWIQKAMEQRQAELSALSLQQWVDRETLDNYMPDVRGSWQENTRLSRDQGMTKMRIETADDKCIRAALDEEEYEMERHWGSGGDEFYWTLVRKRIREWGQGRIQCQLCRAYEWSEMCYDHAAGECTLWDESEEFRGLVERLSSLKGRGRRGEDGSEDDDEDEGDKNWLTSRGTCQGTCRFPRSMEGWEGW
ncbi:hypothetical protein TARUN_6018 [Trichoderma arundinaceum]|uniref:Uncharacterized protein n=1 Tax=Trichoderma arundinaceum TaxID=490622 RepID=A0A395NJZ0_TRIAR|nr:hypothetical protein TARUN_6018 [Trichoderma arundinaceum]